MEALRSSLQTEREVNRLHCEAQNDLEDKVEALERGSLRLRDDLLEYGRHKDGCVFHLDDDGDVDAFGPNGLCTCGLDEARV